MKTFNDMYTAVIALGMRASIAPDTDLRFELEELSNACGRAHTRHAMPAGHVVQAGLYDAAVAGSRDLEMQLLMSVLTALKGINIDVSNGEYSEDRAFVRMHQAMLDPVNFIGGAWCQQAA